MRTSRLAVVHLGIIENRERAAISSHVAVDCQHEGASLCLAICPSMMRLGSGFAGGDLGGGDHVAHGLRNFSWKSRLVSCTIWRIEADAGKLHEGVPVRAGQIRTPRGHGSASMISQHLRRLFAGMPSSAAKTSAWCRSAGRPSATSEPAMPFHHFIHGAIAARSHQDLATALHGLFRKFHGLARLAGGADQEASEETDGGTFSHSVFAFSPRAAGFKITTIRLIFNGWNLDFSF